MVKLITMNYNGKSKLMLRSIMPFSAKQFALRAKLPIQGGNLAGWVPSRFDELNLTTTEYDEII